MILADGAVSESEMVAFRRICKEAFGIPEASIDGVIEYLNEFGYETNGSQAIAHVPRPRRRTAQALARHMAEIAKADSQLAENEVRLLRAHRSKCCDAVNEHQSIVRHSHGRPRA